MVEIFLNLMMLALLSSPSPANTSGHVVLQIAARLAPFAYCASSWLSSRPHDHKFRIRFSAKH